VPVKSVNLSSPRLLCMSMSCNSHSYISSEVGITTPTSCNSHSYISSEVGITTPTEFELLLATTSCIECSLRTQSPACVQYMNFSKVTGLRPQSRAQTCLNLVDGISIRIIERKIHFALDDADRAAPELITTALLLPRTLAYLFTNALQAGGLNLALKLVHFSLNNADGAAPEVGILDRAAEVLQHDLLGGVPNSEPY
jgi:hypothetical protein